MTYRMQVVVLEVMWFEDTIEIAKRAAHITLTGPGIVPVSFKLTRFSDIMPPFSRPPESRLYGQERL